LVLVEVLVFSLSDVSFAYPAEVSVARAALNVIASCYFLDRSHAPWTAIKLIPATLRPLIKVHRLARLICMPFGTALEAHFFSTLHTHRFFLAKTGLFNC